jgi:VIT1/CCC1 family predicted Fe2+/Mn2+ transporter
MLSISFRVFHPSGILVDTKPGDNSLVCVTESPLARGNPRRELTMLLFSVTVSRINSHPIIIERRHPMPSRDVQKAREAYKAGDPGASKLAHQASADEPHREHEGKYIKSVVYGGLDGIITTFAVVSGVAGASLSAGIVLILGFANLIADGISMAIGDYLSTRAENEYNLAERQREIWEVENYPEGEKKEMVELYIEKGIGKEDARTIVDIIAKHKKAWVDIMMVEELGIVEEDESPLKNAVATFLSFGLFGFIPLSTHLLSYSVPALQDHAFLMASVLTGVTLFLLGALKVRITEKNWLKSGIEMLVVGGVAAAAAYLIGHVLSGLA